MPISTLLVQRNVAETRAAALDEDGRPAALYCERWSDQGQKAWWGQHSEAIVRDIVPHQGGAFVELSHGEAAFLSLKQGKSLPLGARLRVRVQAEAQGEKLARVRCLNGDETPPESAFSAWKNQLCIVRAGLETHEVGPDDSVLETSFDDALTPNCPLPGGGRLRFAQTPALMTIDIDTAGRRPRTGEGINMVAAIEAGRHIALRGLAGTLIVDCVGSPPPSKGKRLKAGLVEAYRGTLKHRIAALTPSPFGLLQVSLARHRQPLHDLMLNTQGLYTPATMALFGLRQLQREAEADRANALVLALPEAAFAFHKAHEAVHREALMARYGARLDVRSEARDDVEVFIK